MVKTKTKTPKIALDDAAGWRREARQKTKSLKQLSAAVTGFLKAADKLLVQPSSHARGKRFAALMNYLDQQNDMVRYFELGVDYKTDKKT